MEMISLRAAGRQVIERYGPTGFRVAGVIYRGSILVFPDQTIAWAANSAAAISWESLQPVIEHGEVQVLLLGLGRGSGRLASPLRALLRDAGIAAEPMDTGAACRTYNVLVGEERRVAAALIPPA
jgi:uncharacterized protein